MNERTDVFLNKFREEIPEFLIDMESVARNNNIPVISRATGDVLRYAIKTRRPKKVLEIGTAIGFSALFMREYIEDTSTITTVEKIESRYEQAKVNFSKYDKNNQIELICEDATSAIERLKNEGYRYELIFLDAAKGQYISFLPTLVELLEKDGILITDNVFHGGTVLNSRYAVTQRDRTIHDRLREYLDKITDHEKLESIIVPIDDGVAISRKIKE